MYCSSSRVMRIITGALVFLASSAGIMLWTEPVARAPKPPPVYSVISTTSDAGMFIQREIDATVCTALWVPEWMWSLPFCHHASAERGSRMWCWLLATEKVSSSTSAAFAKPASRSPYDQSTCALPVGIFPSS